MTKRTCYKGASRSEAHEVICTGEDFCTGTTQCSVFAQRLASFNQADQGKTSCIPCMLGSWPCGRCRRSSVLVTAVTLRLPASETTRWNTQATSESKMRPLRHSNSTLQSVMHIEINSHFIAYSDFLEAIAWEIDLMYRCFQEAACSLSQIDRQREEKRDLLLSKRASTLAIKCPAWSSLHWFDTVTWQHPHI